MPLKPLGIPPYLLSDEVEQDDIVEIVEKPYIVAADKTKWGRERGKAIVKLIRTGVIRTWTMNVTTWDKLLETFGDDPSQWLNEKIQIKKETRNVNGVDKTVLFGRPYHEPQQELNPESFNPNLYGAKTVPIDVAKLTPEQKQALLKALSA